jgi:hypothetical protein
MNMQQTAERLRICTRTLAGGSHPENRLVRWLAGRVMPGELPGLVLKLRHRASYADALAVIRRRMGEKLGGRR